MRIRAFLALSVAALAATVLAQPPPAVILITLDGARIEEMFFGVDTAILRVQSKPGQRLEDHELYKRYWAPTPQARREKLLPFFWGTLMREHGSIAGNPALRSRVHVTNRHLISYPGYSELLVGRTLDDVIKSNALTHNPNRTVLEFLQSSHGLSKQQVAVFTSWPVLRWIVEQKEGALTINAGAEKFESPDPDVQRDSERQFATPTPWGSIRYDTYTARFAMDHLARHRPRVLHLAFDETDGWAHDSRYDRLLEAYGRTDRLLQELWVWLQSQPDYRDRTSLLITTDHGRGRTPADWNSHHEQIPGAGETWMAFVSPTWSRRGEWRSHTPLTASQAAATLITWMGGDWKQFSGAAPPVRP
jgi:hypothetical protein